MTPSQIRSLAVTRGISAALLRRGAPWLMLTLAMVATNPAALACGGGGSGSYRKPPRPGQHLEKTSLNTQSQNSVGGEEAPTNK